MKHIILALSILASSTVYAAPSIQGIPDGSYLGKFRGQREGKVNLVVKGYAGCQGCFVAIFVVDPDDVLFEGLGGNKTPQVVAYSGVPHAVPANGTNQPISQYDLTPFGIAADGKLTLPNADPSLSLSIPANAGTDKAHFSIVSASEANPLGLQSGMEFNKEKKSKFELSQPTAGHYKAYHVRNHFLDVGLVIQNQSDTARSAPMNWSGDIRTKSGHFVIKEQIPNVYSFGRVSTLAIGDQENQIPSFITLFVEAHGKPMALLVNPVQSTDVRRYDLTRDPAPQELMVEQAFPETKLTSAGGLSVKGIDLEYPGGPTSVVTAAEIDGLRNWATKAKLEIMRIRSKTSGIISDEQKKRIMLDRIALLASKIELQTKDLLVRQALYAGLTLVRILDAAHTARGATAGEVSQEVDILDKSMSLAEEYYKSDQVYLDGMLKDREKAQVNNQLTEFGIELSQYIVDMSTRLRPINLLASYGALRWSLGVLNRKIMDDVNGPAMLHDTVLYLDEELKHYPDMEQAMGSMSDVETAVQIQGLKKLYLEIQKEVLQAQKDAR